jgi:hypothetical protein
MSQSVAKMVQINGTRHEDENGEADVTIVNVKQRKQFVDVDFSNGKV